MLNQFSRTQLIFGEDGMNCLRWAKAVKDAGVLRVGGTRTSFLFSQLDETDNGLRGFDAGLYQLLARYILGDEGKFELTQVDSSTRESVLQSGQVDTASVCPWTPMAWPLSTPSWRRWRRTVPGRSCGRSAWVTAPASTPPPRPRPSGKFERPSKRAVLRAFPLYRRHLWIYKHCWPSSETNIFWPC